MTDEEKNTIQLRDYKKIVDGKTSEDENENSTLIRCKKLTAETAARLQSAALLISWISIIFSLGTGIAGIVLSVTGRSESLFAYGLDAVLDSLSSVAVVWRFHVAVDYIYSAERERKACIAIGIMFIISATSLILKAVHAIISETRETKEIILYASFALSCGIISSVITAAKIYVGMKIGSEALYTDSIITLVGAVTCFASVAGLELYVENTSLWYLDSVFGIICGLFLLLFGIKLLCSKLQEEQASK